MLLQPRAAIAHRSADMLHGASMTAVCRPLLAHEHADYRTVRLECLRLHPTMFGTTYAEAAATPQLAFERYIADQDPDHVMFGAFVDPTPHLRASPVEGHLSGLCALSRETRQRARHRCELTQMYVAPHAASRGIGGLLIDRALQHAFADPAVRHVVLGVVADNTGAIRLYQRAGFREYGRLPSYFLAEGINSTQLFMVRER